jgi:HAD superfamily hydrolase (TIGR01509 family)
LELTLRQLGLEDYFTSYTASSLVGAGKPDPIIYRAALAAQGVTAAQSLYVDDYHVEADGARALGFTAVHLDRRGEARGDWVIRDLRALADYAQRADA